MEESVTKILVIDDEVGMREGCSRALTSHGFEVHTAERSRFTVNFPLVPDGEGA